MKYDISVVIPMFNASSTIVRALDSVNNQSINVKEVIVVDDGSVDESFKVVESYSCDSSLNIIVHHQKNRGVSCARNKGLSIATGKYVAFLDSDDEWVSSKLELQMPCFSSDDVVLVGGHHRALKNNMLSKSRKIDVYDQFIKNNFQTSTVVIKRCIVDLFGGFYESQKYAEEGRFYFDMLKFGDLVLINEQVVIYDGGTKNGFGESGLSQNIQEMQRGEISNFRYAKNLHNVGYLKYSFFVLFSYLKYIRRFLLVKVLSFKSFLDKV